MLGLSVGALRTLSISGLKGRGDFATMLFVREDYYQLLDAEPTASRQELRAAYRRTAKRYHPDLHADDPAAEERFKLIAEAWRTLGDEEKRAEYDNWLNLHRRYSLHPELEGLPKRHGRVSARRVQERDREQRRSAARRAGRFGPRTFLLRPKGSKVSGLAYVLISFCFVLAMLPYLRHHLTAAQRAVESRPAAEEKQLAYGESPLSPEEQKRNLENHVRRLAELAAAGDTTAQYRYGYILYMGTGGVVQDKEAALRWWRAAAAGGNAVAQKALLMLAEKSAAAPAAGGAEVSTGQPK